MPTRGATATSWLCTSCSQTNPGILLTCSRMECGLHFDLVGVRLSDTRLKRRAERVVAQPLQRITASAAGHSGRHASRGKVPAAAPAGYKRMRGSPEQGAPLHPPASTVGGTPRRSPAPRRSALRALGPLGELGDLEHDSNAGSPSAGVAAECSSSAKRRRTTTPASKRPRGLCVHKSTLDELGGGWVGVPPFSGDEDRLYRWIAEPALWARVVLGDADPAAQRRIIQHHAALHDALDASGFVLWRSLPPSEKLPASSRFGPGWAVRTLVGRSGSLRPLPALSAAIPATPARLAAAPLGLPPGAPAWLGPAWALLRGATFTFMGEPMLMARRRPLAPSGSARSN